MAIFITQGRYTKDGIKGMIATPEDRTEAMNRLLGQVGGKVIGYYLTSGEYDFLIITEGPSWEEAVPATLVAAAGAGVSDLKTVMALNANQMKNAFAKAGSISANYRAPGAK